MAMNAKTPASFNPKFSTGKPELFNCPNKKTVKKEICRRKTMKKTNFILNQLTVFLLEFFFAGILGSGN